VGKLLPSSVYISGRFRCNPNRKRQELAGIDLVSSRFRQDPLDGTIDLGIYKIIEENQSLKKNTEVRTKKPFSS
jgi:hypothetical protein